MKWVERMRKRFYHQPALTPEERADLHRTLERTAQQQQQIDQRLHLLMLEAEAVRGRVLQLRADSDRLRRTGTD